MTAKSELTYKIFLTTLISLPGLLLGAVHPTILGIFIIIAGAFIIYLLFSLNTPPPIDMAGLLLLGMLLFALFQLIPLPAGIVGLIAPSNYDIRIRSLSPLDSEPGSFMPITLDGPATLQEVGKLVLYLAVYLGVIHWTRRKGPSFVLRLIASTGLAVAAVFIAHRIFLLNEIYGVYTPLQTKFSKRDVVAPLVNPNHLAGLLSIGTTVAIGSALILTERTKRVLLVGIAALSGGALMLTLSRGGIAAFVCGQLVFISLRMIPPQGSGNQRFHLSWLPIGLALSFGLGMFVAQDAIIGEFVGGDVKKLNMALEGLPLVAKFWPTGVGRGAFGVTFQMVSSIGANVTVGYAENAIIQLLSDFGIFIGSAVIVVSLLLVGLFLQRFPRRVDVAAALAALVAFGIHNIVDFNSEIPGVAIVAVALLGVLSGSRAKKQAIQRRRYTKPALGVLALLAISVGIASILYLPYHLKRREESRFSIAWKKQDKTMFEMDNVKEALLRHPASWFIPYIVGIKTFHYKKDNPLPWFARAIELNPHSALAHYYVGATLFQMGHLDQSLLELRLAARSKPNLNRSVAQLLVSRLPRFDKLSKIALTDKDKILLWPALANQFAVMGLNDEARIADKAILKVDPINPRPLAREVRHLIETEEYDQAMKLAKRLSFHPDLGPSGIILISEIYTHQRSYVKSANSLENGLKRYPNNPTILRALAWAWQRAGNFAAALEVVNKLKMSATTVKSRADYILLEASISQAEGRMQATLARLREAHTLTPRNTSILFKIATLSEKIGDNRRALDALRSLAVETPNDPKIKERLTRLENQIKTENKAINDKF